MKDNSSITYSKALDKDELAIKDLLKTLEGDRAEFDITRFYLAKINKSLVGCIRTKVFDNNCLELVSLAVSNDY